MLVPLPGVGVDAINLGQNVDVAISNTSTENKTMSTDSQSRIEVIQAVPERLVLRAAENQRDESQQDESQQQRRSRVRWQEGTVDNEHMNKKKSKICCIFHPQTDFEQACDCDSEPSSPSGSSSSESDDDEEPSDKDHSKGNKPGKQKKKTKKTKELPTPNSYEVQPDYTKHRHNHSH